MEHPCCAILCIQERSESKFSSAGRDDHSKAVSSDICRDDDASVWREMPSSGKNASSTRRLCLFTILLLLVGLTAYIFIFEKNLSEWDTNGTNILGLWRSFPGRPGNQSTQQKFDDFFMNGPISEFIKNYTQSCIPGRRIFAILLHNPDRLGFGSCFNNALSAYFVGIEPLVNRRFQLPQYNWYYETLTTFFDDFAAWTHCDILYDVASYEARQYSILSSNRDAKFNDNYTIGFANGSIWIESPNDIVIKNPSIQFNVLRDNLKFVYDRDGPRIFETKSLLAKAIWQPNAKFRRILEAVWVQMLDDSDRFIAVHLRRGDKIRGGEMRNISIAEFSEKIYSLCNVSFTSCPNKVFVMADEDESFDKIYSLLSPDFTVLNLPRLLKQADYPVDDYVVFSPDKVIHSVAQSNRRFWLVHTTQLILEISLLAMADELVCTMTSNICRLAALLKGSHEGNVHSLDTVWYPD